MFYFNISILILVLMLSDNCFSYNSDDDENSDECFFKYLNEYPNKYYTEYPNTYIDVSPSNDQYEYDVAPSNDQYEHDVGTYYNDQVEIDVKPLQQQMELNDRTICLRSLYSVFDKKEFPITYVQKAVFEMILYGEHNFIYEEHVKMYYYSFQWFVEVHRIKLPQTFCIKDFKINYDCLDQIKFFQDEMSYDNILPNFSQRYLIETDLAMGPPYNFSGATKHPQTSSSDDNVMSTLEAMQLTIFKNALFYHKVGRPEIKQKVTNDTMKYFHKSRSFGQGYMYHIMNAVRMNDKRPLDNVWKFCKKLYPYQKPML